MTSSISSAAFNPDRCILLTACISVKAWALVVDQKVELETLQTKAVAKEVLHEQLKAHQRSPGDEEAKERFKGEMIVAMSSLVSEIDFAESYQNSANVLVTKTSLLSEALYDERRALLYTIDEDFMVRVWNLLTGRPVASLLLEHAPGLKLTAAALDPEGELLAVGSEDGNITVHNVHSGGMLHRLKSTSAEVQYCRFMIGKITNLWLVAGCWEGRIVFYGKPNEQGKRGPRGPKDELLPEGELGRLPGEIRDGFHSRDIMAIDVSDEIVVSIGREGRLCTWNTLTGSIKQRISLRERMGGGYVVMVRILRCSSKQNPWLGKFDGKGLIIVVFSGGDMVIVSPMSGDV